MASTRQSSLRSLRPVAGCRGSGRERNFTLGRGSGFSPSDSASRLRERSSVTRSSSSRSSPGWGWWPRSPFWLASGVITRRVRCRGSSSHLCFAVDDRHRDDFRDRPAPGRRSGDDRAGYLAGFAGFVILIRGRIPGGERGAFLDAAILASGIGVLIWAFGLAPYLLDARRELRRHGRILLSRSCRLGGRGPAVVHRRGASPGHPPARPARARHQRHHVLDMLRGYMGTHASAARRLADFRVDRLRGCSGAASLDGARSRAPPTRPPADRPPPDGRPDGGAPGQSGDPGDRGLQRDARSIRRRTSSGRQSSASSSSLDSAMHCASLGRAFETASH